MYNWTMNNLMFEKKIVQATSSLEQQDFNNIWRSLNLFACLSASWHGKWFPALC